MRVSTARTPSTPKPDIQPADTRGTQQTSWASQMTQTSDQFVRPSQKSQAVSQTLPPKVASAKAEIKRIASKNTTNKENIKEVREQLEPHISVLADYFSKNRPSNEVELTRGTWKNLWYDDPDIDRGPGFLKLDRERIWQVIDKNFYTNVAESKFSLFGLRLGTIQSFVKGNYTVGEEAEPVSGDGRPRKNIINLEFADNRARPGKIPENANLQDLVDAVESKERWTLTVPGPKGIKGELWNLYVDENIRISAGIQKGKSKSEGLDLYILERGALS